MALFLISAKTKEQQIVLLKKKVLKWPLSLLHSIGAINGPNGENANKLKKGGKREKNGSLKVG